MLKRLDDYNWKCVFADEGNGSSNCTKHVQRIPGSTCSTVEFSRDDVETIIGIVDGENDGDAWVCCFLLKDGRYGVAEGGFDYTGWG